MKDSSPVNINGILMLIHVENIRLLEHENNPKSLGKIFNGSVRAKHHEKLTLINSPLLLRFNYGMNCEKLEIYFFPT